MASLKSALESIAQSTIGTEYENELFLVGGYVRDGLLGKVQGADADVVSTKDAAQIVRCLYQKGIAQHFPVIYERFGTAMISVQDHQIEFVTARSESYRDESRKPIVEPASLQDDAFRRDFTVNALMRNLHSGELSDLTGHGLKDLGAKILRTPKEPRHTFYEDPLRMLRAVRFRWQLGFEPIEGLYEAIEHEANRLNVISAERIREELIKMLKLPTASKALGDLSRLNLLNQFWPELDAMHGVDQGSFHHLDVWDHTMLAMDNLWKHGNGGDPYLALATLLHDVAKPLTRSIDKAGKIRFFSHEVVGARMTGEMMKRLKFSGDQIASVSRLVKNHMRLGTADQFTPAAARRLLRDMGDDLESLLNLVDADADALKPDVRRLNLSVVRERISQVQHETPVHKLQSPLTGEEIIELLALQPGKEVGVAKEYLLEKVMDGDLLPGDKEAARQLLLNRSLL